jgi:hypothetical protein
VRRFTCTELLSQGFAEGEKSKYCRQNVNENQNEVRQSLMMRLPNQTLIDVEPAVTGAIVSAHRRDISGTLRGRSWGEVCVRFPV